MVTHSVGLNSHSSPAPSTSTAAPTEQEVPKTDMADIPARNNGLVDPEKAQDVATPELSDDKSYLVEFDGPNDPDNPKNWTQKRRWAITICMGILVFTVTFASSIFSVNIGVVEELFGTSKVTATLGVALFVLVRQDEILPGQFINAVSLQCGAGIRLWTYCVRAYE